MSRQSTPSLKRKISSNTHQAPPVKKTKITTQSVPFAIDNENELQYLNEYINRDVVGVILSYIPSVEFVWEPEEYPEWRYDTAVHWRGKLCNGTWSEGAYSVYMDESDFAERRLYRDGSHLDTRSLSCAHSRLLEIIQELRGDQSNNYRMRKTEYNKLIRKPVDYNPNYTYYQTWKTSEELHRLWIVRVDPFELAKELEFVCDTISNSIRYNYNYNFSRNK